MDSISISDFAVDHNVGHFMLIFYDVTNKLCNYNVDGHTIYGADWVAQLMIKPLILNAEHT